MTSTALPRWVVLAAFAAFAAILVLGVAGYLAIPFIIDENISQQMRLTEDSPTLSKWADVVVPIYFSVYMFNITNPEEFAAGGRPTVQQIGPYVYRQRRRKLISHIDEDSVTYKNYKSYHFMPEHSNGSLDDRLYALNVPLVAMEKLVKAKLPGDIVKSLLQPMLESLIDKHNEKLVVDRKVSEMLFDGYAVPMIPELAKLGALLMPKAQMPAANRFGLLYNNNDTADQWFTVGTGAGLYRFTAILRWNNRTSLNFWKSHRCNLINGTDGGQFSPFVRTDQQLFVFVTDLCRSIYFEFEKETRVKGVDTKRFTVPDAIFASGKRRAENECFCESADRCHEGGVIPLSACREGVPIMVSAPHFYQGDSKLVDDVDGLRPEKANHETFLDVQTNTGLVLRVAKRLQINVDLRRSDLLYPLANVPNRIMPIAWIEERMEAPESMTDALKQRLILPRTIGTHVFSALTMVGIIGTTIAASVIVTKKAKLCAKPA